MLQNCDEVRFPSGDPNITFVIRQKNDGFQSLKEIKTTTGEEITGENETTETITIVRKIGQKIDEFPS